GYTNPGVLGLLGAQYQSGPIQTMTCVPATVIRGDRSGQPSGTATIATTGAAPGRATAAPGRAAASAPGGASGASGSSPIDRLSVAGRRFLAGTGRDLLALGKLASLLIGLGILAMRFQRLRRLSRKKRATRVGLYDHRYEQERSLVHRADLSVADRNEAFVVRPGAGSVPFDFESRQTPSRTLSSPSTPHSGLGRRAPVPYEKLGARVDVGSAAHRHPRANVGPH
ncbi:MAG: hypothetical protein LC749_17215, partial [Actinobacteria bacterium]|nr:hypothetical protein [Actinomycetota bacterium]